MPQILEQLCPCESGKQFACCCEPLLLGNSFAATAEALMRSRYTGYVTQNSTYLLSSWHPDTRPSQITFNPDQKWLGLKIKRTEEGLSDNNIGIVEFVARFKIHGRGHRLHEISHFQKINEFWLYKSGEIQD